MLYYSEIFQQYQVMVSAFLREESRKQIIETTDDLKLNIERKKAKIKKETEEVYAKVNNNMKMAERLLYESKLLRNASDIQLKAILVSYLNSPMDNSTSRL